MTTGVEIYNLNKNINQKGCKKKKPKVSVGMNQKPPGHIVRQIWTL
jgi:hypothetical protein